MTLKVLSVDDSTAITQQLNYLFNNIKEVEWVGHAYDLISGKQNLSELKPDLVLLDIMISEESGFELLDYIKINHPNTKVIMLSNLSDDIYIRKSKQMGASHFIDKSFEFDKIPDILLEAYQLKFN
jgi:DNA-binding NarL/FixJ family response regulator